MDREGLHLPAKFELVHLQEVSWPGSSERVPSAELSGEVESSSSLCEASRRRICESARELSRTLVYRLQSRSALDYYNTSRARILPLPLSSPLLSCSVRSLPNCRKEIAFAAPVALRWREVA